MQPYFYRTDLNVSKMTEDELNHIALNEGGVVGLIGGGYALPEKEPAPRHGYRFIWINSRGLGNRGTLVIKGTTQVTKEYLRQGAIKKLMQEYNLDYKSADALNTACMGVPRSREQAVLDYVVKTHEYYVAWDYFPWGVTSTKKWLDEWNMPEPSLTVPRIKAAGRVVKKLRDKGVKLCTA